MKNYKAKWFQESKIDKKAVLMIVDSLELDIEENLPDYINERSEFKNFDDNDLFDLKIEIYKQLVKRLIKRK